MFLSLFVPQLGLDIPPTPTTPQARSRSPRWPRSWTSRASGFSFALTSTVRVCVGVVWDADRFYRGVACIGQGTCTRGRGPAIDSRHARSDITAPTPLVHSQCLWTSRARSRTTRASGRRFRPSSTSWCVFFVSWWCACVGGGIMCVPLDRPTTRLAGPHMSYDRPLDLRYMNGATGEGRPRNPLQPPRPAQGEDRVAAHGPRGGAALGASGPGCGVHRGLGRRDGGAAVRTYALDVYVDVCVYVSVIYGRTLLMDRSEE